MGEGARGWLLRFLRVPAEPSVPGGGRLVRVFRAAPNYYRYRLALWAARQVGTVVGLIGGLVAVARLLDDVNDPLGRAVILGAEGLAWAGFVAQLVLSLAVLRMDFELRWYMLSDRALRIREGILSIREKTVTFANIQQISIRQNPLQRLLGIADVQVSTAGGGSGGGEGGQGSAGETMHEAFFRGVDNAEEIRDVIRERVRLHRDAGLGDPGEPAPATEGTGTASVASEEIAAGEPAALAAARELLDEMRGLRRALEPVGVVPRGDASEG